MSIYAIIYNPAAGTGKLDEEYLRGLFPPVSSLLLFDLSRGHAAIDQALRQHRFDALIAAGGDGTVNAVANWALQLGLPLGVLPAGTLNHFARDVGVPGRLETAAEQIAAGHRRQVDYCTVNGLVFVNNSSIGFYPAIVKQRERFEARMGKWLAAAWVSFKSLFRLRTFHLVVESPLGRRTVRTPLVFIGNNSYQVEKIGFTNRQDLTSGKLYLYVVRANRVVALLGLTLLSFFGLHIRRRDICQETTGPIRILTHKRRLEVALDGEVKSLVPPLCYETHLQGLTILGAAEK